MNSYHRYKPFVLTFLVVLTVWLTAPAIAGKGDPEAARQAWPMIEAGALLVDVRTKEEFDMGHIDGAVNIPHTQTNALIAAIGSDKQRPVVFYCRSGGRAGIAMKELAAKGYTGIFNATGLQQLLATKP